jgi:hypothetical protein
MKSATPPASVDSKNLPPEAARFDYPVVRVVETKIARNCPKNISCEKIARTNLLHFKKDFSLRKNPVDF